MLISMESSLEGCVDVGIVGGETGQLVARVEVDSVEVEEGGVDEEEQVDVARHQEGDDEQRRGSEKLEGKVEISSGCEFCWVTFSLPDRPTRRR